MSNCKVDNYSFHLNSSSFHSSPKCYKIFGLLLQENFDDKNFAKMVQSDHTDDEPSGWNKKKIVESYEKKMMAIQRFALNSKVIYWV